MREALRERRRAMGLSQADVARRIGVVTNYYSQIETGVRIPSLPVAMRLARLMGEDIAVLFADVASERGEQVAS